VVVLESAQSFLDTGLGRIDKSLAKLAEKAVEKGKAPEQAKKDAEATRARIQGSLAKDLADCDRGDRGHRRGPAAKRSCSPELGQLCKTDHPSLETRRRSRSARWPRPRAAGALRRAALLQPVQLMKLVEVVAHGQDRRQRRSRRALLRRGAGQGRRSRARTRRASSSTACSCRTWSRRCSMLERGDATKEDIDAAMQYGCGYRWARSR
jgi:3-hydroxyacyl-CoA dehydrogenase